MKREQRQICMAIGEDFFGRSTYGRNSFVTFLSYVNTEMKGAWDHVLSECARDCTVRSTPGGFEAESLDWTICMKFFCFLQCL